MHFPSIFVAAVLALSSNVMAAPVDPSIDIDALVQQENQWKMAQLRQDNVKPRVMPRPYPRQQGRGMPYMLTERDARLALTAGRNCRSAGRNAFDYCPRAGLNVSSVLLASTSWMTSSFSHVPVVDPVPEGGALMRRRLPLSTSATTIATACWKPRINRHRRHHHLRRRRHPSRRRPSHRRPSRRSPSRRHPSHRPPSHRPPSHPRPSRRHQRIS